MRLTDVITDASHGPVRQLRMPNTSDHVRFEFEGASDFTPPDRMAFVYRLAGLEENWQALYEPQVVFQDLPVGDYTFEVKAVDRDLNYSTEPAQVQLTVHLPYERISWAGGLALALVLVAWQTTRVVRRDHSLRAQNQELILERGLERVRAEVASMLRVDDLHKVISVSHSALNDVGLEIHGFTFIVIERDSGWAEMYDTGSGVTKLDMNGTPDAGCVLSHWRSGQAYHRHDGRRWVVDVPSEFGTLAMSRDGHPFTDNEIALLQRFADVANLGYTRYLDFQQLEERNRDLARARDAAETANRAKSQFLANMSHEIRTPMNAILGYAQILRRSDDLTADHRHAVETIQSSGDHLLKLINDVLDISKIEAGRMELTEADYDLREMLKGLGVMFEMHCCEKGLAWQLQGLPTGPIPVRGDEAKLRQVLINLLGNAVKFTSEGQVTLRLDRVGEPTGNGSATNRYRIEVVDTGPGLSAAEREAVFQPFQQGAAGQEQGGTGLGLAITQRQLELMGSQLELESVPDEGSTFWFEIDLLPAENDLVVADVDAYADVRRLAKGQRVKVLLADDVRENRDILERMLVDLGAAVATATNGREALEMLQADKPDIVFLDIRMPVMDGLEAVRHLRQLDDFKDVKAVAISASVLDHERRGYLEAGFDDFIDKPFRFERICATLAEQLNVQFEEPSDSTVAAAPAGDDTASGFTDARLDDSLRAQIVEAAELYSVTEIEQYCAQLEQAGEAEQQLADHLRLLSQRQDMDGILTTLQRVPTNALIPSMRQTPRCCWSTTSRPISTCCGACWKIGVIKYCWRPTAP